MLLVTGKKTHAHIWKELTTKKQVIQRVDELATKGKHLEMTKGYPFFEWSPGIPIMDQYDNNHMHFRESEDEVKSFHSSDTHDDITGH